ncbi:kinetoplast DNA-associated protein, putative [Bodo saltans]|uniref:Kinetoplast DNA-associated protein, putative n=1 Tax=Bodo saltans TaxID=75058 RepID=A0A0S4JC95_BODSA|nr:kinetoplast DNA-associated protein, putative [Bodo saltans]|eukprot:CUG89166.1 kinetoplast DNA-associated protein, putative [Bodo saltans]
MFRRTIVARIGPFSLFMKESKGLAALQGLSVPQRGAKLGELYRSLSKAEAAALKDRAAAIPSAPRRARKPRIPAARPPSPYNLFVKKNMPLYEGRVADRMKVIAELWKTQQNKKKK